MYLAHLRNWAAAAEIPGDQVGDFGRLSMMPGRPGLTGSVYILFTGAGPVEHYMPRPHEAQRFLVRDRSATGEYGNNLRFTVTLAGGLLLVFY